MIVTKEIEIDMGHRVPNHKSKCRNLHGHRYKIEVGVDGNVITEKGSSDEGMVIDFGDLKEVMMQTIDAKYDHSFTIYEDDAFRPTFNDFVTQGQKIHFVPFVPTAENLAKHWFEELEYELKDRKIQIEYIRVWETPTSTAYYAREHKVDFDEPAINR